jgi:hypothetical protein
VIPSISWFDFSRKK